jgi:hypothetical protein
MFLYDSRVIAIDPEWPFKDNELLLTMEHEYGHALGLPHRYRDSIMKPGWDPPFASGPTEQDFSDLRRIWAAKADPGGQHDPASARDEPSRPDARKANKPQNDKINPSGQILLAIANVHLSGRGVFTWLTQRMPRRCRIKSAITPLPEKWFFAQALRRYFFDNDTNRREYESDASFSPKAPGSCPPKAVKPAACR